MFVFRKCERSRAMPVTKATGKKNRTLKRLRSFLDAEEPQTVQWLVNTWHSQQAAVTYKELREAILSGGMSEKQLQKWQRDYSLLVNNQLAPQWEKAMAAAAAERAAQFPYFLYDPGVGAARSYVQQHGAELVTNLVAEQRDALRAMIEQASYYEAMTADSLSRIMRPVIGLTKPQAKANLHYYTAVKDGLLKANPNMREATAEKRARDTAARYAARQHRYRAFMIARTELAAAYNQGAYGATVEAQERGYIGDCRKIWLTAADERVCIECGGVDGESVNMDAPFSNGAQLPPAHPNCRCAVAYEEITDPLLSPDQGAIVETQDTTAATGQTVGTADPADDPLTQAGQNIATAPEPAEGEPMMAEDVFGNLNVLPESHFGTSIRSDGDMLEGQNLTGRIVTVDGFIDVDYYEISGKLTNETWGAIVKDAQANGKFERIVFEEGTSIDGRHTESEAWSINGYRMVTPDGVFEVYADYDNPHFYGYNGYFRVRVPVSGDLKYDKWAMSEALDKAGLSGLMENPTSADELLMQKSRLAWQHAPHRVSEYEGLTGAARERKIDEILRDTGISQQRVAGLQLQEVFPGYSTYVDTAAVGQYKQAGLVNVWAGVSEAESVRAITTGKGMMATNTRAATGMKMTGASPEADMRSGGSSSVFTRLGVDTGSRYGDSFMGDNYRIIINPDVMGRTDWYAYYSDEFGTTRPSSLYRRDAPVEFIKSMAGNYRSGNEIMFRYGISSDQFIGVSCENDTLRQRLIDEYRAAGITEVNGTPIEQFVKVSKIIGT